MSGACAPHPPIPARRHEAPVPRSAEPPAEARSFPADEASWTRLGDDDAYTDFKVEKGQRFAIVPLRKNNFPPGFDLCTAEGGDIALNERQQWARAELKVTLEPGTYDVTLASVPEKDGESSYRLVIDGKTVATFTAPPVGREGAEDRIVYRHTWKGVAVPAGARIQVWARAHSNLQLEEAAHCRTGPGFIKTYAWARGRFDGIAVARAGLRR